MHSSVWTLAIMTIGLIASEAQAQIEWQTDVDKALAIAAAENKLVLLHFSADWCRPCKHLETFVFRSAKVGKAIHERLVPVHIDTDSNPDLIQEYAIKQIPTDVILAPSGRILSKRKSPSDSDNYIRMVQALSPTDKNVKQQNAEVAQLIRDVEQSNNGFNPNKTLVEGGGDFEPNSPSHRTPELTNDLLDLEAKSKMVNKLVDHEVVSGPGGNSTKKLTLKPKSQRVINDQFFSEKTYSAESMRLKPQGTSPTESQGIQSANNSPVSRATIRNPFAEAELEKEQIAAKHPTVRILAPNKPMNTFDGSSRQEVAQKERVENVLRPSLKIIQTSMPNEKASGELVEQADCSDGSCELSKDTEDNVAATTSVEEAKKSFSNTVEAKDDLENYVLAGKCAVTLIRDGKWAEGDRRFGCIHRGRTFLFATAANLAAFQTDPEAFSPLLVGYDPVDFHEHGKLVPGQEEFGVFMGKSPEQKIVLFSSERNKTKFQSDARKYMSTIQLAVQQSDAKMR